MKVGTVATLLLALCNAGQAFATDSRYEVLRLNLPAATTNSTPPNLPLGPNVDSFPESRRGPFLVPKGVVNLAAGQPVFSSVHPFTCEVRQITDGRKEPTDYDTVQMKRGSQWVQVDLGNSFPLYAIVMWHDHRFIQVIYDVIVQVSDDPDFQEGVTTLFNNDHDNSSGLGIGLDSEYFETRYGKIVDACGISARYVRCYTKGGNLNTFNSWQEIEVYGLTGQPAVSPASNTVTGNTSEVSAESESEPAAVVPSAPIPVVTRPPQEQPRQVKMKPTDPIESPVPVEVSDPAPPFPLKAEDSQWKALMIGLVLFLGATLGVFYAMTRRKPATLIKNK